MEHVHDAQARTIDDDECKLVAKLAARAALAGYELIQLPDESFIVRRWGLLRALPHPAAAEKWLDQVGAPKA